VTPHRTSAAVLIVDDDGDDIELARLALEEVPGSSYRVATAKTFEEGLALLGRQPFDVCLVDYRLGARDGIDFICEARAAGATVPMILLTGGGTREIDLAGMAAGASDFLDKSQLSSGRLEQAVRYAVQHKRLEDERARAVAAEVARFEAEQANRAKDRFLAVLGHELRNPLAVIANATRLLSEPASPAADHGEERAFALAALNRQVATMRRLVDDLLDVARLAHGKLSLLREPLDLVALSRRVLDDVRPSLDARQLFLSVDLPPGRVPYWGDATRLEQMLLNLLSNAEKYTDPGGRVTFRLCPAEDGAGEHLFEITDDGIGMSASMAERAFDLFVQDDSAAARSRGGLGLGLSLVRRLAELHGGTVEATSLGAGQGTTLRIRLVPVASPPPGSAPAAGNGGPNPYFPP
jgi:signal transduction histidine kinase